MSQNLNTFLLYVFVILLLFCIMYIFFYNNQKLKFDDNVDNVNLYNNSIHKNNSKEKFETVNINSVPYYVYNPPESSRQASSVSKAAAGFDFISSMLDTLQGWSAKDNILTNQNQKKISVNKSIWLQMDLGTPMNIAGVITQARGPGVGKKLTDPNPNPQMVSSYVVIYSNDTQTWTDVDNGRVFAGNTDINPINCNMKINNVFQSPINARYIRIIPMSYINFTSMRAALLISNEIIIINNKQYVINADKTVFFNNTIYNITNPIETNRRVNDNYVAPIVKPGYNYISSMLDSPQGWSPKDTLNLNLKWLKIDLETVMNVFGVITQGGGPTLINDNIFQSVTSYKVMYSNDNDNTIDDNIKWRVVDNADIFPEQNNKSPYASNTNMKIVYLFKKPIVARYIVIIPQTFTGTMPSIRAGLLTTTYLPTIKPPVIALPPYYGEYDGLAYNNSLDDTISFLNQNSADISTVLSIYNKTVDKRKENNDKLINDLTEIYFKQYLEYVNKTNAVVYNQYTKYQDPKQNIIYQQYL
jgi:hypothetical protein